MNNGAELITKEQIFSSLINLENWRNNHNKNDIGFGYDPYKPDQKFHYAEAYALWGNGYLKLYQITQNQEYLDLALKCAAWLIENKKPKYENYSWGLPWGWNQRGAPEELSYLITTVFVGDFLLSIFNYTHKRLFLNVIEGVAEWILNENGAVIHEDDTWFYYANHPSFNFLVINPISKASAFFSKLYLITKNKYYRQVSIDSARFVISKQNSDGSWFYGAESNHIDNTHTGFTIEGLCDVYFALPSMRTELETVLRASYDFYWYKLYMPTGFGLESLRRSENLFSKVKRHILGHNPETRLWGYASGIRALLKLSKILLIENKGLLVANYAIKNLQSKNGAFMFKSNFDAFYVRHEAHIFDALASLISKPYC